MVHKIFMKEKEQNSLNEGVCGPQPLVDLAGPKMLKFKSKSVFSKMKGLEYKIWGGGGVCWPQPLVDLAGPKMLKFKSKSV